MSPIEHRTHSTVKTLFYTLGFIAVTDFLFWSAQGGLSYALLICILSIGILSHGSNRTSLAYAILLIGIFPSALASSFDWGFCSTTLLTIGLLTLNGEVTFAQVIPRWHRGIEALWAIFKFPGRFFWLIRESLDLVQNIRIFGPLLKWIILGIPITLVTLLFATLLGTGNAILGQWCGTWLETFWTFIKTIDLDIFRFLFWGFLILLGLAIYRPSIPTKIRFWTKPLPEITWEPWKLWSSQAALVLLLILNALFFLSNTIDTIYLWGNHALPSNVTMSGYLHEGVWSLSIAAIFSGLLLAFLWLQGESIRKNIKIRVNSLFWVVQNLLLLAGVLRRLLLYVESYNLSTQRIYVAVFLLLVTIGFIMIATMIVRNYSVRWLLGANTLSALICFYLLQFLPVNYWVAHYNVDRWFEERDSGKKIDLPYLNRLGSSSIPALQKFVDDPTQINLPDPSIYWETTQEAQKILDSFKSTKLSNWRKWQGIDEWTKPLLKTP